MRPEILIGLLSIFIILWNSSVKEGFTPAINQTFRKKMRSFRLFSAGFINETKFRNIFRRIGIF